VETSWRMVEGEHDSFDTSVVPDHLLDDDILSVGGSGPSQLSNLSQLSGLSSQSNGDWDYRGSSQDSSTIQDFITRADDERVIMRSPFQPSVPGAVRRSQPAQNHGNQSPEPVFYMPRVDIEGSRHTWSARSSGTIKPPGEPAAYARQRRGVRQPRSEQRPAPESIFARPPPEEPSVGQRLATSLPHALYDTLAWAFGVVGMAFRYAQKPLALALAIYFVFGALMIASTWLTQSFQAALSPICSIPGLTMVVDLPFCPSRPDSNGSPAKPVEFDSLMSAQEPLEDILEKSAGYISLPLDMMHGVRSVRSVRTMVLYSNLDEKDLLLVDLDSFIEATGSATHLLHAFNIHVGSTIDAVININTWTKRQLERMAEAEQHSLGWISNVASWIFAPFQPVVSPEQTVAEKYVQHTAGVSRRISQLIDEAYDALSYLVVAEDHLDSIHAFGVSRSQDIRAQQDGDRWMSFLRRIGVNIGRVRDLDEKLKLLHRVEMYRKMAATQLTELIADLTRVQLELGQLGAAVEGPDDSASATDEPLPLAVHIETINSGIERLQHARRRIREEEQDRFEQAAGRRKESEKLIEA
ncbi:hypothetical protein M406DRAFT_217722, partial [Cryphonectria parasitica EP155]